MTCEEEDLCGSYSTCRDETVGPAELMDDYWFFQNMLNRTRVFKLKPSTDSSCSRTSKEMAATSPPNRGLPSIPSNLPREDVFVSPSILRTPSLPPCIAGPKTEQKIVENQGRPGKTNLQRSFSSVDHSPLSWKPGNRTSSSKVTAPKMVIPRQPSRQDPKTNGVKKDYENTSTGVEGNYRRPSKIKSWKSLSDLEIEEVQGFMDLGFVFNKEEMNPSILKIIPGLKDRSCVKEEEEEGEEDGDEKEKVRRRPYLSEAWLVQRPEAPKLNWVDRRSAVDMKEQLRVWARTVASNVRQEC